MAEQSLNGRSRGRRDYESVAGSVTEAEEGVQRDSQQEEDEEVEIFQIL
jgi:hypothetical protein